jgi:hypothetical protein
MNDIETIREEVRAAVVKACPDVMGLNFGCWVTIVDALPERVTAVRTAGRSEYVVTDVTREWWPVEKLRIIGRPINLEDALRTIESVIRNKWLASPQPQETLGNFQPWLETNGAVLLRAWHLGKPLDDQSDETIRFLDSILV